MWRTVLDRRAARSNDLRTSLELLLRTQRQRGELEAIALATDDGVLVASDGPKYICEELAAYAPLIARGRTLAVDAKRLQGVTVNAFLVGRQSLVLAIKSRHTSELQSALALSSMKGATRILAG